MQEVVHGRGQLTQAILAPWGARSHVILVTYAKRCSWSDIYAGSWDMLIGRTLRVHLAAISTAGKRFRGAVWLCGVHCLTATVLIMLAGALAAGSPPRDPRGNRQKQAVLYPPQALICGPNALYMFLKAHGKAVSPDTFFAEVSVENGGLSLAHLRQASVRHGLPAEVRRCSYAQLVGQCPLPVIAMLQLTKESVGPAAQGDGHYVLVLDADLSSVLLVDGTAGEMARYPRDLFCSEWQGYVLVPTTSEPNWFFLLAVSGALWAMVGWFMRRSKRAGRCLPSSTHLKVPMDTGAI